MEHEGRKVFSTPDSKSLKSICDEIDAALHGGAGINLDPEYQREYKFTVEEESLLIESIIMGIPIPTIYLSSDTRKVPYIANVIDGQHRLRAVYRFINNEFSLKGLEILKNLNEKSFNQLDGEMQNSLLHQSRLNFENIHVQDNPIVEIEIFKRYNKGTHPLSRQEFRNAIYVCEFNLWLNTVIKGYFEDPVFNDIYNISKKRYADKTVHESISVMLSILKFGLNIGFSTSPVYADHLMDYAVRQEDQNLLIEETKEVLDKTNEFLKKVYNDLNVKYPFSKEIYGIESRNYKLQTPILMLVSGFLKYLFDNEIDVVDDEKFSGVMNTIKSVLSTSYLEEDFKGSNTRPSILRDTLNDMIKEYELNFL
ncbi:DUF262 domain-containing protein [Halobacillus sp. BBL2006]|uniref:DUF262 domain-containing protein n=1 Tax=Halobacillus sp. BBL2006 TaxID=1543706 RepID=UPI0005436498|nr:DUF262 domain-containing protein [Halobacillus sp. BBL2006]KHE67130.1 hypothetical protein LD39_19130 [Halobacillus sp. BBL2006]